MKSPKEIAAELKRRKDEETKRQNAEWKKMQQRIDEEQERLAKDRKWFK